jgi:GNAT superfamily N-acetyltransferase
MGRLSRVEALADNHNLELFSSGSDPLDNWLRKSAPKALASRMARVFVTHDDFDVKGYYALAASSTLKGALPANHNKRLPRHPIPMALLARLAVDLSIQGQGVGRALVADAIERSAKVSLNLGIFGLVTNAKDEEAIRFYESLHFFPSTNDPTLMIFPLVGY